MDYYITVAFLGELSLFVPLLAALIPYQLILRHCDIQHGTRAPVLHMLGAGVFCYYLVSVLSVTGVPDFLRARLNVDIILSPFWDFSIAYDHLALNALLFMPFGFLLPLLWERFEQKRLTFTYGAAFSLMIELAQLFSGRVTDINDLITNTLGTVLGYYLYKLAKRLFGPSAFRAGGRYRRSEPFILMAFAWVAVLFVRYFTAGWALRLFR